MISLAQVWSQALPFQQFHVLFNPLFKVLFIFRSLYLCAIAAFPNYSTRRRSFTQARHPTIRGSHPLWRPVPGDSEGAAPKASSANYNSGRSQISNLSCCRFTRLQRVFLPDPRSTLGKDEAFNGRNPQHALSEVYATTLGVTSEPATGFQGLRAAAGPQHKPGA
ncbi:hypothetical protein VTI74DRAFT_288 [Chaetomium olivicolor]